MGFSLDIFNVVLYTNYAKERISAVGQRRVEEDVYSKSWRKRKYR